METFEGDQLFWVEAPHKLSEASLAIGMYVTCPNGHTGLIVSLSGAQSRLGDDRIVTVKYGNGYHGLFRADSLS